MNDRMSSYWKFVVVLLHIGYLWQYSLILFFQLEWPFRAGVEWKASTFIGSCSEVSVKYCARYAPRDRIMLFLPVS